jgi:AIPR protein
VRDYLGTNQVNEDIEGSLSDESAPDFWWLNNGITILATNATVPGKTIQLQDIQIVNGLQTTETIYRHFQLGSSVSRDRALLVKILVSTDVQARDRIIRATNNQSPVEVAALHATDKIQRDIEEILERNDWYYERRRNYYRNIGKPQIKFVTPLYLASAVIALIFKNPARATRLKSKFMRNQVGYDAVFSTKLPLHVWPILVDLYKQVDFVLGVALSRMKKRDRYIRSSRALVSLIAVARRLGTFSYTPNDLLEFRNSPLQENEINDAWNLIQHVIGVPNQTTKPTTFVKRCCEEAASTFGLSGIDEIGRREIPTPFRPEVPPVRPLSAEFVSMVDSLLPAQPWQRGIHAEVASKLNCDSKDVTRAISQLIADGKRKVQRDGMVFEPDKKLSEWDPIDLVAEINQESTLQEFALRPENTDSESEVS